MAQLQVTLVEAKHLKQKDTLSANDAYVQIYFDDKKHKQKSKTKQNSNNPIWNQSFIFNHLTGQDQLHIDVYDQDSIKDDLIGSVIIDLRDLYEKRHIDHWFDIIGKHHSSSHGQIHLILDYQKLEI